MIKDSCPCCGSEIDLSNPGYSGFFINKKNTLSSRIITLKEMIAKANKPVKVFLQIELDQLTKELKRLS